MNASRRTYQIGGFEHNHLELGQEGLEPVVIGAKGPGRFIDDRDDAARVDGSIDEEQNPLRRELEMVGVISEDEQNVWEEGVREEVF